MATAHMARDPYGLFPDIECRPLSALERQCLLLRIGECHAVVRCAIAGILSAQQQHQTTGLASICAALKAADVDIAVAACQAAALHDVRAVTNSLARAS